MDAKRGVDEIANRFFCRQEADALRGLPAVSGLGKKRTSRPWERVCLSHSIVLTWHSQVTPASQRVDSCSHELSQWRLYDVPAALGYVAAIVVEGQEHRLQKRIWEWGNLTVDPE